MNDTNGCGTARTMALLLLTAAANPYFREELGQREERQKECMERRVRANRARLDRETRVFRVKGMEVRAHSRKEALRKAAALVGRDGAR